MCVISQIGDHYTEKWRPFVQPTPGLHPFPNVQPEQVGPGYFGPSRREFDALRAEVEECLRLLKAAREIDTVLGQAECQTAEKIEIIKKIAALVGVDISDILA